MHILDASDWILDDGNDIEEDVRATVLREWVQLLKEELPQSHDMAWNHPDEKFRIRWRAAIRKELHSLIYVRKVWRTIKRRDLPPGRRCVRSKWAFDVKRDGTFKVRLVACGCSQIPGVDFEESYSPVINDVSWRLLLVLRR